MRAWFWVSGLAIGGAVFLVISPRRSNLAAGSSLLSYLRSRPRLLSAGAAATLFHSLYGEKTNMTFLDSIEGLAASMNRSATHIGACLKHTHPAHIAYGTLHRLERCMFDTSEQMKQILSQVSREMRDKLSTMED